MPTKQQLIDRLKHQGITHPRVLEAMAAVPREQFVPDPYQSRAYDNVALPIHCDQTISQPYIVALMTQALLSHPAPKKILEIGTGSGYQAAILATLFEEVWTIERIPALYKQARHLLSTLGYKQVHCIHGDGFDGCPEESPFDGILVTAAASHLPEKLVEQLSPKGGLMVIPLGDQKEAQKLTLIKKDGNDLSMQILEQVYFVPMISTPRPS